MSGLLAFVIEDDPLLSTIFSEAVRQAGYTTAVYQDGCAALQALGAAAPYLILLDMRLPGVSGQELLRFIRTRSELADSLVILATADPLLADIYQDQADFVLIKPISFGQLRDLAQRVAAARGLQSA